MWQVYYIYIYYLKKNKKIYFKEENIIINAN